MINPSFKELSEISSSRYEVCVMVMKRARRLVEHSSPRVKSNGATPVTIALDEIMAKQVYKAEPDTVEAYLKLEEELRNYVPGVAVKKEMEEKKAREKKLKESKPSQDEVPEEQE